MDSAQGLTSSHGITEEGRGPDCIPGVGGVFNFVFNVLIPLFCLAGAAWEARPGGATRTCGHLCK